MTRSPRDDLEFAPVHLRFELEQVEQRGDVTTIRRARERATGRSVGIERALPAFAAESESRLAFAALDDSRSQLRHPHVLEHYDVAVDDESPYSVVEWPAGGTLAERLVKRGPLGELELLKVARSVSSALEHAAARRIHHGGVVPENLCLTADGGVKVAGFGFDRLRAASRTGRPGESDPAAADVHELCRTLYRLATAAERFEAERIARLPEWLRELLGRGLDDPARRFRDAAEFLAALERLRQVAFGGGRGDSYEPTVGIAPRAATGAGDDTARAPGSGSGSKGSGSRGSGSKGSGSAGRRGSPDEFPWRPLDEQYELVGAPKQGGMGAVFQARELATGRFVAVKRMKPGVSIDQDAWRRFHREASSIANLNHPHVLHLMQAGRDEHGDYLVLEWASGGSLLEKIQTQGRLDAKDVFALARKIGSALVYAHGKGCIHRDIKPHNILISDSGEPKLADFGLARTLGDETLTTAGGGAGSLHYMAPEQSEDARHADERSDLYSFAKTLYHAATGRKPIAIDGAALPVGLRKPLLKAISDRREDRHASMAEFLADLERGAGSKQRSGRTIAAAVVVLGALVAGATILKDEFARRDRSGRIAETPGSDAGAGAPTTPPRSDASAAPDSKPAPDEPTETTAPAQEGAEPAIVATDGDPAVAQPDPPAPSPPAADPEPDPQETPMEPATGTGAPEEDPALAARYGEMIQSAAAWDDEWRAIVATEGEGNRELLENDDRRAGLEAWERARALRDSDLRAAVREAENAVHALRRGFSLATVVWLRGALDAAIAPGSVGFDPDRVEGLLGELRGYVPEFATAEELQRYSTAVLARAREATKTGDAAKEPSGADPTAAPKEGEGSSNPAAGSDPETEPGPVDPDDPWSVAIDAIRRHPGYGGLVIAKDPTLRPLGPDPGSGLFEFLLEGSGEPPEFAAGKAVVAADTGIVLVLVPGGSTQMGSHPNRAAVTAGTARNFDPESQKSEQPEHTVELAPFLIGKHELTAAQWSRLSGLAASGSVAPASGMTWAQASATLAANGLTLPTEAQWEHACRGGASTPWHTGSDADSARDAGHLRFVPPIPGRPLDQPLPVGSLAANGFGLHDVMGNVAEYCRDPWPGDHTRARHAPGDGLRTEASGPFRVFRGGCFKDHPKRARSAARDFCPADNVGMKTSVIGIRVARAVGVP